MHTCKNALVSVISTRVPGLRGKLVSVATARSREVAMITNLWCMWAKIDTLSLFCVLVFHSGWEDGITCTPHTKTLNETSISCKTFCEIWCSKSLRFLWS